MFNPFAFLMPKTKQQKYNEYLRSPGWQQKRGEALRQAGYRCSRCGAIGTRLDVHHKTYEHFKKEKPDELEVLCRACHNQADEERIYEARLNGWANKVYGLNWRKLNNLETIEAEFDAWLEEKAL